MEEVEDDKMHSQDEPLFPEIGRAEQKEVAADLQLENRIRHLVEHQLFGVLCTEGQGQPYGSMIAFAFSDDLSSIVFATPTATRKYRLLTENGHVALVVDNRPSFPDNMMKVEAITVTGRASEIERGPDYDEYARLLVARHPQLEAFVKASSCGLFVVDVLRFFHVSRFQAVAQWLPPSR